MQDVVDYRSLNLQLAALIGDETDLLANTANFVGLLYSSIPDLNWLGVYVARGGELVLGPFQGRPACVRIPFGSGVCGTAAAERRTVRVDDVDEFEGHIVCDPASASEIVVPLMPGGELVGVLDIDSPSRGRFSEDDTAGVQLLCDTFVVRLAALIAPGGRFL